MQFRDKTALIIPSTREICQRIDVFPKRDCPKTKLDIPQNPLGMPRKRFRESRNFDRPSFAPNCWIFSRQLISGLALFRSFSSASQKAWNWREQASAAE